MSLESTIMKKLHLIKSLLLYVFLDLCSTACNDDDGQIPMPNPETACRLVDNFYYQLEYNENGYVSKLIDKSYYPDLNEQTFTYNANNQVEKVENYVMGEFKLYNTFEYTNSLLTAIKGHNLSGGVYSTREFKYDNKNRVIEEKFGRYTKSGDSDDIFYIYDISTYTYDSNNNLTKEEKYSRDRHLFTISYEDYDNNPTSYAAIRGLPTGFFSETSSELFGNLEKFQSFSKNNARKVTRFFDNNNDGIVQPGEEKDVTTLTYTYNSNGYPEVIRSTVNGGTYVMTLDYECD